MSDGRFGREIFRFPAFAETPKGRVNGHAWYVDGWLQDNLEMDLERSDSPAPIVVRDMTGQPIPEFLPKKRKNADSVQRFWYSVRTREDATGTSIGL